MAYSRPCKKCGETFQPTGKLSWVCENCKKIISKELHDKRRATNKKKTEGYKVEYFANKQKLDEIRDNVTIQKWKILSRNYKLGKRIWGVKFTREKLAEDLDLPYATALRCLSLDRCNERNWELYKQGKISSFKLAMICSLKNYEFQDKIVDIVIKDEISTSQIKELNVDNIKDMNVVRHELAIAKGYSRENSAYSNFKIWINRGERFMKMNPCALPKDKIEDIKLELKKLKKDIKEYIEIM